MIKSSRFRTEDDFEVQEAARQQVDTSFTDYISDLALAVPRGITSAAQDIYGLADTVAGDALPDWERAAWQESSTAVGGLAEGIVNFATGFIPVVGVLGKVGKLSKVGRVSRFLQGTGGAANRIGRDFVAGAATDFLVWDGHEERFSNLVQEIPGLENPVTQWLAANEEDGEIEGRIKNVLEGGALGLMLDATFLGLKRYVFGKRELDAKLAAGASREEAEEAAERAAQSAVPDEDMVGAFPNEDLVPEDLPLPERPEFQQAWKEERRIENTELQRTPEEFADAYEEAAAESEFFVQEVYPSRREEFRPYRVGGTNLSRAAKGEPINRGAEKILETLKREKRLTAIDTRSPDAVANIPGTIHVIETFIDNVGRSLFSDINLTIKKGDAGGRFHPVEGIVEVGVQSLLDGKGPWVAVHELYHSLERFADPKELQVIRDLYQSQKAEYIAQNPLFGELLEKQRLPSADRMQQLGFKAPEAKKFYDEGYRFINESEFFAELLTEKSLDKITRQLGARQGSTFQRFMKTGKILLEEMFNATAAIFGFRKADAMVDDIMNGKWKNRIPSLEEGILDSTSVRDNIGLIDARLHPGRPDFEDSLDSVRSTRRPVSLVDNVRRTLNDLRNIAKKYVDDPVNNPRKLTEEELAASFLERNNLNVGAAFSEDAQGVVRALEQFHYQTFKDSAHKKKKSLAEMTEDLVKEVTKLENQAGDVDLATHLAAIYKSGAGTAPAEAIAQATGRIRALQTAVNMQIRTLGIEGFTDASLSGLSERGLLQNLLALDDLGYLTQMVSDGRSELGRSLRSLQADVTNGSVNRNLDREARAAEKAAENTAPIIDPSSDLGAAAREARLAQATGEVTDAQVSALIERAGGRKVLMDRMKEIKMIYDVHGDIGLLQAAKVNRGQLAARFLETVWMSSMLSGPRTLLQNLSTLTAVASKTFELFVGGAGVRLTTGSTAELQFAKDFASGLMQDWGVAWRWAAAAAREQRPIVDSVGGGKLRDLDKAGKTVTSENTAALLNREIDPESPLGATINMAGNLIEYPFKVLQGTDEFVGGVVYNAHLSASAKQTAREEGLTGAAFDERVQQLVNMVRENDQATSMETIIRAEMEKLEAQGLSLEQAALQGYEIAMEKMKSPDYQKAVEMSQAALGTKRELTFTDPLDGEGAMDRMASIVTNARNEFRPLKFFVPFVKTPFNLLKFAGARSTAVVQAMADTTFVAPLRAMGMVEADRIWGSLAKDLRSADPAVKAAAMGRAATGLSLATTTYMLAAEGVITGAGPQDPEMRKVWEEAGNQAYSIKVGDGWMAYDRMDPLGLVLGGFADIQEAHKWTIEDEESMEALQKGLMVAVSQNILNKSYFTGIANLVHTLEDPGRRTEAFLESVGRSAVPLGGLGRALNNFDDPVAREARGFLDAALQSVPVIGRYYKGAEIRNVLGEPVKAVRSAGGESVPILNAALPWVYRSTSDDEIFNEFARVQHGFTPPRPQMGEVDLTDIKDSSGQAAYDYWLEQHGKVVINGQTLRQALKTEIRSPEYQRMSPESSLSFKSPRVDAINSIIKRYRREALKATRRKYRELDQHFIEEDAARAAARLGFDPALIGR